MSDNAVWHLKVVWHHDFTDEPVEILSEIGSHRYEVRKVEVYRDGRLDWADEWRCSPSIGLGEVPVPEPEEIDAMDEFSATPITAEEFEAAWKAAQRGTSAGDHLGTTRSAQPNNASSREHLLVHEDAGELRDR